MKYRVWSISEEETSKNSNILNVHLGLIHDYAIIIIIIIIKNILKVLAIIETILTFLKSIST